MTIEKKKGKEQLPKAASHIIREPGGNLPAQQFDLIPGNAIVFLKGRDYIRCRQEDLVNLILDSLNGDMVETYALFDEKTTDLFFGEEKAVILATPLLGKDKKRAIKMTIKNSQYLAFWGRNFFDIEETIRRYYDAQYLGRN